MPTLTIARGGDEAVLPVSHHSHLSRNDLVHFNGGGW